MQNIDGRVNAVDSSRLRAPTAYAEGVHRQPAQCPDSPRSTTRDTIGCLQACELSCCLVGDVDVVRDARWIHPFQGSELGQARQG